MALPNVSDGSRDGDAIVLADHGTRWLACRSPDAVLEAAVPGEVAGVLREAEARARTGRWFAVGFVAYEAGAAYGLATHGAGAGLPLAAFALYRAASARETGPPVGGPHAVIRPVASVSQAAYRDAFARAKHHIGEGDSYQVNGTFTLEGGFDGDPLGLFAALSRTQRGRYAAFLRLGGRVFCSASPELFVARQGCRLVARPMKGSAPRGRSSDEDRAAAARLQRSEKERAENVMVVDMVRNDLGRIARVGTVRVRRLFAIERYPTIWQMTSEVAAECDAPLDAIFAAMFPSASITGAPKARTMDIIRTFEGAPRGVYTGAIGYIAPGGDLQFNVAIRTAVIDPPNRRLSFGVGSGIVWDSDADAEYRECLLKGLVLAAPDEAFELLETLAWAPQPGYAYRAAHLRRLQRTAAYFGVPLQSGRASAALDQAVAGAETDRRVRLLVSRDGGVRVETAALEPSNAPVRACLAADPIDPLDWCYYHKTTRRNEYDRRRCPRCDDVILWNADGEITESTIANVVIERHGALVTPPVSSGLLPGTAREALLFERRITESRVTVTELRQADAVWLVNSVRGWRRLELVAH